jgi:hypothetical protein
MTDKVSQRPVLPLDPPERFAGGEVVAAVRCPVDVSTYPRRHVIVVRHAGEFADAMQAGHLGPDVAADGLRRWQRFLGRHLHAGRDPRRGWTDFPPRKLRDLAALPAPLGPVVTAPG